MSSMLLSPIMRWPAPSIEARREETLRIGSPRVFQTAPPQPASNARSTIEPMFVGGADASQKGLGDLMPAKLTLRSAICFSFDALSKLLTYPAGQGLDDEPLAANLSELHVPSARRERPLVI